MLLFEEDLLFVFKINVGTSRLPVKSPLLVATSVSLVVTFPASLIKSVSVATPVAVIFFRSPRLRACLVDQTQDKQGHCY